MKAAWVGALTSGVFLATAGCGGDDASMKPFGPGADDASSGSDAAGDTSAEAGSDAGGGTDAGTGDVQPPEAAVDAAAPPQDGGEDAGNPPQEAGPAKVGNPELFTEAMFEMDFSQGTFGRYRAKGGAWTDFGSWDKPGDSQGHASNGAANIHTTQAVRTEIVENAVGAGRVLHTWVLQGDTWRDGASYPRTELLSTNTGGILHGEEWRMELPFYVGGDLAHSGTSTSLIGFQLHDEASSGSPPFALFLRGDTLSLGVREDFSSLPWHWFPLAPLQANTLYDVVVELKFGYPADGAYLRLWLNGSEAAAIDNLSIGYPQYNEQAGYFKYCSIYDWANLLAPRQDVYTGPVVRFSRRP